MADPAQLLLLKGKLNKTRRDKRNITILGTVISVMYFIMVEQYWKDFLSATIAWVIIGVLLCLTVIRHYNAKEAQVIRQKNS